MISENDPYPYKYDYQVLDRMLLHIYDPKEIGRQLDETMSDLVDYAGKEEHYCQTLTERHHILRELRDIFWSLKKEPHGNR